MAISVFPVLLGQAAAACHFGIWEAGSLCWHNPTLPVKGAELPRKHVFLHAFLLPSQEKMLSWQRYLYSHTVNQIREVKWF